MQQPSTPQPNTQQQTVIHPQQYQQNKNNTNQNPSLKVVQVQQQSYQQGLRKDLFINSHQIRGIILDISGVLKNGDVPIRGSVEAVSRLQKSTLRYRVITDESLKPRKTIYDTLSLLGYEINEHFIISPVTAMYGILKKEQLRPYLLIHPRMIDEFRGIETGNPNCVVIGDADEFFTYEHLNDCFRKLINMENPLLFSLGNGKYYLDSDGLALDTGSYTKGIEYATGINARKICKPSYEFFLSVVHDMKLEPSEVIMIGDDIDYDIAGAQKCGIRSILIRTGKYKKCDEKSNIKPDAVFDNLLQALNVILEKCPFASLSRL